MAVICGIELKSSDAILAIVKSQDDEAKYVDTDPKRMKVANDENVDDIRSFYDAFINFLRDNHVDQIVIKKRAKRGPMAGGAVTFKIEGLIQLNGITAVDFISGPSIAAVQRRVPMDIPKGLNKYQEQAFLAACTWLRK